MTRGPALAARERPSTALRRLLGMGRTRRFSLLSPRVVQLTALVLVLAFWQAASGVLFNRYYLGTPGEIVAQITVWIADGSLLPHVIATVSTTALGFLLAAVAGIGLAIPLALNPRIDRVLSPFIYAAFALPKVVLAPLMIFWLGVGFAPSLAISAVTAFFFVFYNSYDGLRMISPALVNSVTLMGASPIQLIVKVRLPAAAPAIALGLHQGLIYAFHGTIVGEMTASNLGIGYVIIFAATDMNTTAVLSGLIVLAVMALGLTRAIYAIARRLPGGGGITP